MHLKEKIKEETEMSNGLTYPTRSQALALASDLRLSGHQTSVRETPEGEWKVYIMEGELTTGEEGLFIPSEEEMEVVKGIREHRVEQRVKELTKPVGGTKEERAKRQEAIEKEQEKLKQKQKEMKTATLNMKKEQLKRLIDERTRKGHADPGVIVPVYDPITSQITDYQLVSRSKGQRIKEEIEREFRTGAKQIELKEAGMQTLGTTLGHMEGVKGGMKAQARATVGEGGQPQMRIARLPSKPESSRGIVGADRPSISKIGSPGMDEANNLGIRTNKGFGAVPTDSSLKKIPQAKRVTGGSDETDKMGEGFAGMFMRKKIEEKPGE